MSNRCRLQGIQTTARQKQNTGLHRRRAHRATQIFSQSKRTQTGEKAHRVCICDHKHKVPTDKERRAPHSLDKCVQVSGITGAPHVVTTAWRQLRTRGHLLSLCRGWTGLRRWTSPSAHTTTRIKWRHSILTETKVTSPASFQGPPGRVRSQQRAGPPLPGCLPPPRGENISFRAALSSPFTQTSSSCLACA